MEIACAIGADGVVFHVGSHLGAGFEAGTRARAARDGAGARAAANDTTWLLMENSAGAGGTIGRSIDELATLLRAARPAPAARRLPRLVPPLRLRRRRHRRRRARRAARRGRRLGRARPAARAARQRLGRAARVEPRPAREHRRRAARRGARRLPRQPPAAGTARGARDRGPGQHAAPTRTRSARRRRCAHALSLGDPRRGDARAGELLRASPSGCRRSRPRCARTTGSRSARPASCSAPSASACSSRCCRGASSPTGLSEQVVIAIGLRSARLRADRRRPDALVPLRSS